MDSHRLDKNTNTGDKIYSNIFGAWLQNTSIEGSLMIRPHFTDNRVTGIENRQDRLSVYPNPATNRINIEGNYDNLYVHDIAGRPLEYDILNFGNQRQLLFATSNKGLIFIVFEIDGEKVVHKILLSN
jgi:hypothetical protein